MLQGGGVGRRVQRIAFFHPVKVRALLEIASRVCLYSECTQSPPPALSPGCQSFSSSSLVQSPCECEKLPTIVMLAGIVGDRV